MTRHATHLDADSPLLRGLCEVVKSHRPNHDQRQQTRYPRRPDAGVLSKSIPLFFIGRSRNGLWIAREAEGRTGGVFLLKRSALRFAQENSEPVGCATMFLAGPINLDTEDHIIPW